MVQEKYIGLALAVSGSLAIGSSSIITKIGLNDAARKDSKHAQASEDHAYLRNPIWWAGLVTMVLGELANFVAYTFAPAILVTPLGVLSVLVSAVLASLVLNEKLGPVGRVGCAICLIGSIIIVLQAPEEKEIFTVDEILSYALEPGFLFYCFTVATYVSIMIYYVSPRYGRKNPMVYISICSLTGSVSIMAIKGFGLALKLTISGKNQFRHLSTYVFAIVAVFCAIVQLNYFNKALDIFPTNVANTMYYVCFSTATIVASLILLHGFNTTPGANTFTLLAGFVVTFLGVHLLNLSRREAEDILPHTIAGTGNGRVQDTETSILPKPPPALSLTGFLREIRQGTWWGLRSILRGDYPRNYEPVEVDDRTNGGDFVLRRLGREEDVEDGDEITHLNAQKPNERI